MKLLVYLFCCIIVVIVTSTDVSAAEVTWSTVQPVVHRNEKAQYESTAYCPSYIQNVKVETVPDEQRLCMFDAAHFRIATGVFDGFGWGAAISFPFDTEFHRIDNVCGGVAGCVYAPETDILIERYRASQYYLGAHIYKNASDRIHRTFDGTGGILQYVFDRTNPDYTVTGEDMLPLAFGSFGISENGQWMGFEIPNVGTARMNLLTGQKRRVEATGITYGLAHDPILELAISNDGNHIAVIGEGTNMRVIDATSDCGDTLEPLPDGPLVPVYHCPLMIIKTSLFADFFYAALHPSFDNGGGQLTFYVISYGEATRRVSLRAPGYQRSSFLGYLAMGDSFSSGEGESDDAQYFPKTNDQFEKCHSSRRAYPFLLAQMSPTLGLVKNVACAGAIAEDVTAREIDYEGQRRRLGMGGRKLSSPDQKKAQTEALEAFIPGRIPQSHFLHEYEPDLLTIGIGGNDVGFMTKLKSCAMPSRCEWASNQAMIHRTGVEIQSLFKKLVDTYEQLKHESPFTKIVAIGYPEVINPEGNCDPITSILLDHDERVFMNEGLHYLNKVIEAAAYNAHISYGNIEESLLGSRLCDGAQRLAMNGLKVGDDISLVQQLPMLKVIGNESFHPNPYGHERIASKLSERYGDLLTYHCLDICTSNQNAPPFGNYWREDSNSNPAHVVQRAYPLAVTDEVSQEDSQLVIDISPYTFQPNSKITFEIHSNSLSLGELQSNEVGGAKGVVRIPANMFEGFHTLHAFGNSFSGKSVDLYQGISYGVLEENTFSNIQIPVVRDKNVDKIATIDTSSDAKISPIYTHESFSDQSVLGTFRSISSIQEQKQISAGFKRSAAWDVIIVRTIFTLLFVIIFTIAVFRMVKNKKKATQDRGG